MKRLGTVCEQWNGISLAARIRYALTLKLRPQLHWPLRGDLKVRSQHMRVNRRVALVAGWDHA